MSAPTAKSWVELLEKLYVVFLLPPYSAGLARSIRKDRRRISSTAPPRDKEGGEVDFDVTLNRRVHWLIEVKAGDDELSRGLRYYQAKLKPKESLQLVLNLARPQERAGTKILPLASWLESLPFTEH